MVSVFVCGVEKASEAILVGAVETATVAGEIGVVAGSLSFESILLLSILCEIC